jgi:hypothetical protein
MPTHPGACLIKMHGMMEQFYCRSNHSKPDFSYNKEMPRDQKRKIWNYRIKKVKKQKNRRLSKRLQRLAQRGMLQLSNRLKLDLPDAFAGHIELLPYFF